MDFLGNPMGLLNDVTEGMNELIKYGNVGGLIRSVTHGVSNSAAKVAKVHILTVVFTSPSYHVWFSITAEFDRVIFASYSQMFDDMW